MNRKLLNDVRKVMLRRGFLLRSRIFNAGNSKPFRPNVKLPGNTARLDSIPADKESINRLKSLSK